MPASLRWTKVAAFTPSASEYTLSCGCPQSPNRLHYRSRTTSRSTRLRLPPDLPSVTLSMTTSRTNTLLRLPPDLPSVTLGDVSLDWPHGCGCPPISHRLHSLLVAIHPLRVAVAPRSPIGYTVHDDLADKYIVAVAPRSPIGYTWRCFSRLAPWLRLPPDLPSVTLSSRRYPSSTGCGCPPISHRLHSRHGRRADAAGCGCPPISHRLH